MASAQIIKALKISNININEIILGTKKNNKMVQIVYKSAPLVFQSPFMEVTGQLKKTRYPNIYQLDTLFKGDSKNHMQKWYEFIEELETHIVKQVEQNGSKWFQKKEIVIKSLTKEMETDKGTYFIKWPIDLQTNIFVDEYKKQYNPNNLKSNDLIKLIVEISNLWIDDDQVGLAVIVQKILVKPYEEKITSEYIFDENDSDSAEVDDKSNKIISLLATERKTRPVKRIKAGKNPTNTSTNTSTNASANTSTNTANISNRMNENPNSQKNQKHEVPVVPRNKFTKQTNKEPENNKPNPSNAKPQVTVNTLDFFKQLANPDEELFSDLSDDDEE